MRDRRRRYTWEMMESNPTEGRYGYQIEGGRYLVGSNKDHYKPSRPMISRAKLLWATEVIRCWWADRLPLPPEPSESPAPQRSYTKRSRDPNLPGV